MGRVKCGKSSKGLETRYPLLSGKANSTSNTSKNNEAAPLVLIPFAC